MFRFRLRTLLIVLALGPPVLAVLLPPLVARLTRRVPRIVEKKAAGSAQFVWRDKNGVVHVEAPPEQRIAELEWELRIDRSKPVIPYVPKSK